MLTQTPSCKWVSLIGGPGGGGMTVFHCSVPGATHPLEAPEGLGRSPMAVGQAG